MASFWLCRDCPAVRINYTIKSDGLEQSTEKIPISFPNYEGDVSSLSRAERLQLRNMGILVKLGTGMTREQICQEYRLSERQLRNIIRESQAGFWIYVRYCFSICV
ncbi:MAG TPA: hypothetical protein VNK25_00490 [Candidatus Nitrosotenuis sp.]|nr:hypothetical protein [Candidatus Nitrosotenuis sp.]